MGQFYTLASVGKSKGADISVSSVDGSFSFFLIHWMAIIFFNNETFVNSEMLIKMQGNYLSLVITVPHSSVPALIHCSEKLQYRHMKI